MWQLTDLTKKTRIPLPIIQAPMAGGATTADLVATVSNQGGLGSLAAGYLQPAEMSKAIRDRGPDFREESGLAAAFGHELDTRRSRFAFSPKMDLPVVDSTDEP